MEVQNIEESQNIGESAPSEQPGAEAPAKVVKEAPSQHEPPEESPRWNQVYGKMKHLERQADVHNKQISERDQIIEEMRAHQAALNESVQGLTKKTLENSRPDPLEDPDAYDAWMVDKVKADMNFQTAPAVEPLTSKTPASSGKPAIDGRLQIMEQAVMDAFPDYLDVVDVVKKDMDQNPVLQQSIMRAKNPFVEAYKYGTEASQKREAARKAQIQQAQVAAPSGGPVTQTVELTDVQKKTADQFGMSHKDYAAQVALIEARRRA
jgi:hypothetical protein